MFNGVKLTTFFMASTMLATSAIADVQSPFFTEVAEDDIRQITTSDAEIQAACPQLQNISLQEIPFMRIPIIKGTHEIYFPADLNLREFEDRERVTEIDAFRFQMLQAADGSEQFFMHINFLGGSTDSGFPVVYAMLASYGSITTYASENAASMAFTMLISGTNGNRYVDNTSYLMTHEITMTDENGATIHADDAEITDRESLDELNQALRQLIEANSVTKITPECTAALVQSKTDVQIMPQDAFKLGLIDYSIDWANRTAMMRVTP